MLDGGGYPTGDIVHGVGLANGSVESSPPVCLLFLTGVLARVIRNASERKSRDSRCCDLTIGRSEHSESENLSVSRPRDKIVLTSATKCSGTDHAGKGAAR